MLCNIQTVKVPTHYHKKPSEISAVEVAHPGASYNPTYADHQVRHTHTMSFLLPKIKLIFSCKYLLTHIILTPL